MRIRKDTSLYPTHPWTRIETLDCPLNLVRSPLAPPVRGGLCMETIGPAWKRMVSSGLLCIDMASACLPGPRPLGL